MLGFSCFLGCNKRCGLDYSVLVNNGGDVRVRSVYKEARHYAFINATPNIAKDIYGGN